MLADDRDGVLKKIEDAFPEPGGMDDGRGIGWVASERAPSPLAYIPVGGIIMILLLPSEQNIFRPIARDRISSPCHSSILLVRYCFSAWCLQPVMGSLFTSKAHIFRHQSGAL